MKSIRIITTLSINLEPTVKNRIEPIIYEFLEKKYFVQLISPDSTKIKINSKFFDHKSILCSNIKPRSFLIRAGIEAFTSLKLLILSRRKAFDLNIITAPSMFLLFFSFCLSPQRVHLDIRDLTWEYFFKESIILRLIRRVVNFNLNLATSITVTNPSEKLLLEKNYKFKKPISILTNGISLEKFNKINFENIVHQKNIVVSYVGNIGHAQDLNTLVNVAKLRPEVKFQIIGTGVLLSEVQNYSDSLNVTNISFLGRLEWDSIINIYNESDILFASLKPMYLTAVPSKLYEYLSTGKYVIYTGGGEARNFLNIFSNCKTLEYGDANALSNTILEFAQSDNFRKLSFSNREIIRKFYIREKATQEFVLRITKT